MRENEEARLRLFAVEVPAEEHAPPDPVPSLVLRISGNSSPRTAMKRTALHAALALTAITTPFGLCGRVF